MSVAKYHEALDAGVLYRLGQVLARWPWSYVPEPGRDLRLDLLRGFCVFAMVVNHIGGESWLYPITGGNRFFVSAAEGFVFISGLVLGMVSLQRIRRQGLGPALWAVMQRAWMLYLLTIALTLTFAIYVDWLGLPWGWGIGKDDLLEVVVGTVTLHRTFFLIDVLLLYTFLLAATPIALLFLIQGRTKALLLGSWALWGVYQIYPDRTGTPWHVQGGEAFPLAAWQVLFVTGLVFGYHRDGLARRLLWLHRGPYFATLAVLFVLLVLIYRGEIVSLAPLAPGVDIASLTQGAFEKTSLAPGRLVALAIVFQFAYLAATLFWSPVRKVMSGFLLPMGQNALYAYTMQVVVIGVFLSNQLQRVGHDANAAATNTMFQLGGVGMIWLLLRCRPAFLCGGRGHMVHGWAPVEGLCTTITECIRNSASGLGAFGGLKPCRQAAARAFRSPGGLARAQGDSAELHADLPRPG